MTAHYAEWIRERGLPACPVGLCGPVTAEMQEDFPELRRVRGHVMNLDNGKQYPHWWLVAPNGEIVDPTAGQFDGLRATIYEEWSEGEPEPTGRCIECGGYVFDSSRLCSAACQQSAHAYYNGVLRGR